MMVDITVQERLFLKQFFNTLHHRTASTNEKNLIPTIITKVASHFSYLLKNVSSYRLRWKTLVTVFILHLLAKCNTSDGFIFILQSVMSQEKTPFLCKIEL